MFEWKVECCVCFAVHLWGVDAVGGVDVFALDGRVLGYVDWDDECGVSSSRCFGH